MGTSGKAKAGVPVSAHESVTSREHNDGDVEIFDFTGAKDVQQQIMGTSGLDRMFD